MALVVIFLTLNFWIFLALLPASLGLDFGLFSLTTSAPINGCLVLPVGFPLSVSGPGLISISGTSFLMAFLAPGVYLVFRCLL